MKKSLLPFISVVLFIVLLLMPCSSEANTKNNTDHQEFIGYSQSMRIMDGIWGGTLWDKDPDLPEPSDEVLYIGVLNDFSESFNDCLSNSELGKYPVKIVGSLKKDDSSDIFYLNPKKSYTCEKYVPPAGQASTQQAKKKEYIGRLEGYGPDGTTIMLEFDDQSNSIYVGEWGYFSDAFQKCLRVSFDNHDGMAKIQGKFISTNLDNGTMREDLDHNSPYSCEPYIATAEAKQKKTPSAPRVILEQKSSPQIKLVRSNYQELEQSAKNNKLVYSFAFVDTPMDEAEKMKIVNNMAMAGFKVKNIYLVKLICNYDTEAVYNILVNELDSEMQKYLSNSFSGDSFDERFKLICTTRKDIGIQKTDWKDKLEIHLKSFKSELLNGIQLESLSSETSIHLISFADGKTLVDKPTDNIMLLNGKPVGMYASYNDSQWLPLVAGSHYRKLDSYVRDKERILLTEAEAYALQSYAMCIEKLDNLYRGKTYYHYSKPTPNSVEILGVKFSKFTEDVVKINATVGFYKDNNLYSNIFRKNREYYISTCQMIDGNITANGKILPIEYSNNIQLRFFSEKNSVVLDDRDYFFETANYSDSEKKMKEAVDFRISTLEGKPDFSKAPVSELLGEYSPRKGTRAWHMGVTNTITIYQNKSQPKSDNDLEINALFGGHGSQKCVFEGKVKVFENHLLVTSKKDGNQFKFELGIAPQDGATLYMLIPDIAKAICPRQDSVFVDGAHYKD